MCLGECRVPVVDYHSLHAGPTRMSADGHIVSCVKIGGDQVCVHEQHHAPYLGGCSESSSDDSGHWGLECTC